MSRLQVLACAFACSPPGKPGFTGGESLLGWNLIRQIARFNEVWVITYAPNQVGIEESLSNATDYRISFCYISLPKWLGFLLKIQGGHQLYYYLWQVKAYLFARRLHREIKFDLFHHVTYANDWMASFIGALLPIPYLRGPCGGAQWIPRGFLKLDTFKGRLFEHCRTTGQWLFRHDPFFIVSQNRSKTVLICNPEAMDALPKRWEAKAQLFPVNGVSSLDLGYFSASLQPKRPFQIITAGKLIRLKGFDLAIKAFEIFVKKCPDSCLTIVGDGPDLSRLNKTVESAGLGDNVKFNQWIPRESLLKLIASSDVFLFSGLRDGGGAVVVEAMAVGKPVVCLAIGGPAMHIDDYCGFKISATTPLDSAHGMADALEQLYKDENLRKTMGNAARQRALNVYHWDRAGDRLKIIYDNLVSTPTGPALP